MGAVDVMRKIAFVVEIAAVASIAGLVLVAPLCAWDKAKYELGLHDERWVELYRTEYPAPVLFGNQTAEGRFYLNLVAGVPYHTQIISLASVGLRMYLGPKRFPTKVIFMLSIAHFLSFFLIFVLTGIEFFFAAQFLLDCAFAWIALKFISTRPAWDISFDGIIRALGNAISPFLVIVPWGFSTRYLPMEIQEFAVVYYALVLPLTREVSRYFATKCTWYLTWDAEIQTENETDPLNRQSAWIFATIIQILWATYFRLSLANFDDKALALGIVVWQAILEIGLRLTVEYRDSFFKAQEKRYHSAVDTTRGLTTRVLPSMLSERYMAKITTVDRERGEANYIFYSTMVLVEMMSEYVGISASIFLIYFWRNNTLLVPFPWYIDNSLNRSFDGDFLFGMGAFQVGMEIVVDTVCILYEKKVNAQMAWTTLTRTPRDKLRFFFLFSFLSVQAVCFALLVVFGDDFTPCDGENMCYCVYNGIQRTGFREAYCKKIYPNATWNATPPILGPHVSNLTIVKP